MKKIHREVRFDALNMRTSRDIQCRGPVLNLGQWVRHMDDKMWFAEVRRETLRLLRDCYGWVA